ncbi:MmgE/PrpD family protein [Haloglomus litoreum]|uniref:MmgE/PrpD family protein n=1 Tax=Haloglomus litoreum TaxID=3034026 RepID=UPI0023E8A952|nr:MmgE/PrpD family protein [Haloglomus sp. DT116]
MSADATDGAATRTEDGATDADESGTVEVQAEDLPFVAEAAEWAATLRFGRIPAPVRRAAGAQLTSTVGAAVWTLDHPIGDRILDTVRAEFPEDWGPSATLPGAGPMPVRGACYGTAALAMAMDFDDTVLGGHTGHSAALVPYLFAEANAADLDYPGRRALRGHVAANEIAARIASAAAVGPFRGQQTAYVHSVGAAVARGVVEGDDAETLADAIAIALGQPPWPLVPDFLGSDAKVLSAAEPTLAGLSAVSAARNGLTGNEDVVTAEDGFLDEFSDLPLPEFLGGLGERWHTRAVTVKPYPGCAYVTAPVHAALRVRKRVREAVAATATDTAAPLTAQVTGIRVDGSLFSHEVDSLASRYTDRTESPLASLNFSIPYNVAVALRDGEHTPRQLRPERVGDEAVWELADRVSIEHDPAFTMRALESEVPLGAMLRRVGWKVIPYAAKSVGPVTTLKNLPTLLRFVRKRPLPEDLSGADKAMGARVTVRLADGREFSETVEHPPGFAGRALDETRAIARRKLSEAMLARGAARDDAERVAREVRDVHETDATLADVDAVLGP